MSLWPQFWANRHEIRTRTGDNQDLVVLSGHAGFNFKGSGSSWKRDEFLIPVGPQWSSLQDVAPLVTISAIANSHHAVNAGWAIDNCSWSTYNGALLIKARAAIRDVDGWLIRIAYHATCIGRLR